MDLVKEIARLKEEKKAVILAHFYVRPEVQDIADYLGDSLGLAQMAAKTTAPVIVCCGVHFMAETVAILCPQKKVLIPHPDAGCSLAESIGPEDILHWKAKHPDGVVVTYVNTSAAVKAYSDYCCTSANALRVVEHIAPEKKILFVPDKNLGGYIRLRTARDMEIWQGDCCVHRFFDRSSIISKKREYPGADILIHPESSCSTDPEIMAMENVFFYSTSGMINHVRQSGKKEFVIVTEPGVIHRMKKENPQKTFIPVCDTIVCSDMKRVTLEKVLHTLQMEYSPVVIDKTLQEQALLPIRRMLEV